MAGDERRKYKRLPNHPGKQSKDSQQSSRQEIRGSSEGREQDVRSRQEVCGGVWWRGGQSRAEGGGRRGCDWRAVRKTIFGSSQLAPPVR